MEHAGKTFYQHVSSKLASVSSRISAPGKDFEGEF